MTLAGKVYAEKKAAGTELLTLCQNMLTPEPMQIGLYRGLTLELSFDSFSQEYRLAMIGQLRHVVTLGTDVFGNIQRMDNLLESLPVKEQACREKLSELHAQLETAKAELDELGVESDLCKTDIADRAQVQALADYAASLGSVKQIIHTSGVSPSDTGTENIIKINAVGTVNMVEAFYPVLAKDGVMINFASVAAYTMPQTDEWTEAFEAWNEPNFYDRLLSHAHASEAHRQSTGNCRKSAGADPADAGAIPVKWVR